MSAVASNAKESRDMRDELAQARRDLTELSNLRDAVDRMEGERQQAEKRHKKDLQEQAAGSKKIYDDMLAKKTSGHLVGR